MHFEATEENKLIYMDIFKKYTDTIETYLNDKLAQMVPNFDMEKFVAMLADRKDQIDEPLMDLLLSFSDFESFKEMMLFARAHFVATTPKIKSGKAAALGLKSSAELQAASSGIVGLGADQSRMRSNDLVYFESCIDGLQISGKRTVIHKDETTEGEARPDLDMFGVCGTKMKK